jgi:ATP-binding cassette subfamily F protein 3
VKVLSGGEKTRLAMIKLLLEPVNFLILDEPTNHLDMKTKDVLKKAIRDFNGTVIVVSHDREFLDGLVEKVYEFGGGKVRECLGGIYEFLEKKKIESLSQLELSKSPTEKAKNQVVDATAPAEKKEERKLSYAEQREREKAVKRAEKKARDAEADVSRLEQVVKDIEAKISEGDVSADIFEKHKQATKDLENAMSVWELAMLEVDELK